MESRWSVATDQYVHKSTLYLYLDTQYQEMKPQCENSLYFVILSETKLVMKSKFDVFLKRIKVYIASNLLYIRSNVGFLCTTFIISEKIKHF